jgi:hypothetical protein
MILKIFSTQNLAKILASFAQTTASFCKNSIITLVFEKTLILSPKIVIITSTPDEFVKKIAQNIAQPIICKTKLIRGKSSAKMWATSVIKKLSKVNTHQKLPKVNNHPLDEICPNWSPCFREILEAAENFFHRICKRKKFTNAACFYLP